MQIHLRERHIEGGVIEVNVWFSSGQCKGRTAGHDEGGENKEMRETNERGCRHMERF